MWIYLLVCWLLVFLFLVAVVEIVITSDVSAFSFSLDNYERSFTFE